MAAIFLTKLRNRAAPVVAAIGLIAAGFANGATYAQTSAQTTPPNPFAPIRQSIATVIQKWKLSGVAVAVALNGQLPFAASFGMADVEAQEPMRPDTLMRLASVSKLFTAVGVLRLVDEGRLGLDDKAFFLLSDLSSPSGTRPDPRVDAITIRHLLQHAAGWEFGPGFDPFLLQGNEYVAAAMGQTPPVDCSTVIRFMRGQPLDFDPGSRYAYANFNYCILGRIIERVSKVSYADYMQQRVLKPSGITRARLGRNLLADRLAGEAKYYTPMASPPSALRGLTGTVPWPYGGFNLEAMDAFGGWVMSAIDIVRFLSAIDGLGREPLLRRETRALIEARPAYIEANASAYQGLGFRIRPLVGGANWWNYGYLPGSASYAVRAPNGFSGAILINSSADSDENTNTFTLELEQALLRSSREVKVWPRDDMFNRYQ